MIDLDHLEFPVVQVALDLTAVAEAIDTAQAAVDAGVPRPLRQMIFDSGKRS